MLSGKTALITGAGRGIGRAIALAMAKEGARVIVNYRGSREKAEAVREEILAMGAQADIYGCDVSDPEAVREMFQTVTGRYAGLDIPVSYTHLDVYKRQIRLRWARSMIFLPGPGLTPRIIPGIIGRECGSPNSMPVRIFTGCVLPIWWILICCTATEMILTAMPPLLPSSISGSGSFFPF